MPRFALLVLALLAISCRSNNPGPVEPGPDVGPCQPTEDGKHHPGCQPPAE